MRGIRILKHPWLMAMAMTVGCGGASPPGAAVSDQAETTLAAAAPTGDDASPDHATLDPFESWLSQVRLRVERPTRWVEPEGDIEREGEVASTWTSPDGRKVTERYAHGVIVVATLEGPPTPEGVSLRLLPVLHPASWPDFALVIEGRVEAIPFFSGGEAANFRIELQRPPVDERSPIDPSILGATHRLHFDSCPPKSPEELGPEDLDEYGHPFDRGCYYYGDEASLAGVGNVPGGWWLRPLPTLGLPDGYRWGARSSGDPDHGSSLDPRLSTREMEPYAEGEILPITRVDLLVGRRWVEAFVPEYEPDEWGNPVQLLEAGPTVLVALRPTERGTLYVSRHDARTGRRIGDPIGVGLSSREEPHNVGSISLDPVLIDSNPRTPVGIAMAVGAGDLLFFETPSSTGRWVPYVPRLEATSEGTPAADEEAGRETDEDEDDFEEYEYASPETARLLVLERCDDIECIRDYAP